jgi:hypothetical protein
LLCSGIGGEEAFDDVTSIDLSSELSSFVVVPASASPGEALEALDSANAEIALVGDEGHPQALISKGLLTALNPRQRGSLSDLAAVLPPLMVVEDVSGLSSEELQYFALFLDRANAPGLAVYSEQRVVGVLGADRVAANLTLRPLTRGMPGLYGQGQVQARAYVCRRCLPVPTRRWPRSGEQAPVCPRDWLHGPMEREYT